LNTITGALGTTAGAAGAGALVASLLGSDFGGGTGAQNQGVDMSKVGNINPRTTDFGIGPANFVGYDQYGTSENDYEPNAELLHNLNAPGYNPVNEGDYGYKLAWSDDFAAEYEKSKGRDIRLWMPLLIDEDVEGLWAKARWDWYDAVSDVYADNFPTSPREFKRYRTRAATDIENLAGLRIRKDKLNVFADYILNRPGKPPIIFVEIGIAPRGLQVRGPAVRLAFADDAVECVRFGF
jgi:hypothetical protein